MHIHTSIPHNIWHQCYHNGTEGNNMTNEEEDFKGRDEVLRRMTNEPINLEDGCWLCNVNYEKNPTARPLVRVRYRFNWINTERWICIPHLMKYMIQHFQEDGNVIINVDGERTHDQ